MFCCLWGIRSAIPWPSNGSLRPYPAPGLHVPPNLPTPTCSLRRLQGAQVSSVPQHKATTLVNRVPLRPSITRPPLSLRVMDSPFPSSEPPASDRLAPRAGPSSVDRHSHGVHGVHRAAVESARPHQPPREPRERCSLPLSPSDTAAAPGCPLLRMLCCGLIAVPLGPCLLQEAVSLQRPPPQLGPAALCAETGCRLEDRGP